MQELPAPQTALAVEFLRRWAPEGPWAVTSIRPDRKGISTATFHPGQEEELHKWVHSYNGQRNLYWSVNPPLRDLNKKAEREDIREVAWLHVDIDPRAGEDLQEEQARALALLNGALPASVPPPTVVVFSGGGYQGFWKLKNPIPVNGDLAAAEEAARYNRQLEVLLGADNCHNIDRIMRLPGTINLPDARKLKRGRVPVLAQLVEFHPEREYDLTSFRPAPALQLPEGAGLFTRPQRNDLPGGLERLASVDELNEWNVPDRVKVAIVQGHHPDEPKEGDNSRSAWLFDVLCQLLRCEVPEQVIYAIITDPEFQISTSILDKGTNAEHYAVRQVERAKEHVENPWLCRLNEQFAVIGNMGGKCRVIEEVMDHTLRRTRLTRQSFQDFANRFMHRLTQVAVDKSGAPVLRPVGKWWLGHPKRRQYETLIFAPEVEVPDAYNLWRGFSYAARPGDCSLFLTHMRENVCGGNERYHQFLLGWAARLVQQPASTGEVAIVLRGGRGVGKSFFAKVLGALFGRHFLHVSNPSHLVGNFNAHLRDVVLLFADEAFYANDKKHTSILKTLVTEETITIEAKGIDAEAAPNYVHLIMASNDQHVVPAGGDERRFFVLDVGDAHQSDVRYFSAIQDQLSSGGYEALLHLLLEHDLSDFEVRNVPATAALREQKQLSLNPEEEWWYTKLLEGRTLPGQDDWAGEVRKDALYEDYVQHAARSGVIRRGSPTSLGRFLFKVVPSLTVYQRLATWEEPSPDGWSRKVKRRTYFYGLPPLATARRQWEQLYGEEDWSELPPRGEEEVDADPF